MLELIDSHCHIHDSDYDFIVEDVLTQAARRGVKTMICVASNIRASKEALAFSKRHKTCHASLGIHPHEAIKTLKQLHSDFRYLKKLARQALKSGRVVAIGECGLDYFYHKQEDVRRRQRRLFSWHLELAKELQLPVIGHIRNASSDFWSIYERCQVPMVWHSFTDGKESVKKALQYKDFYFGISGIMTFTKDQNQLDGARQIPLERMLLETDAPYLTPAPYRGKVNKPEYLPITGRFMAQLQGQDWSRVAKQTTANARQLFSLTK